MRNLNAGNSGRTPLPVTRTPSDQLESVLAANVGAIVPVRDSYDAEIIQRFVEQSGDQSDMGRGGAEYPVLAGGVAPDDSDADGMPDDWERAHGLDPNDDADGPAVAANGYTNVEIYLNELAGD